MESFHKESAPTVSEWPILKKRNTYLNILLPAFFLHKTVSLPPSSPFVVAKLKSMSWLIKFLGPPSSEIWKRIVSAASKAKKLWINKIWGCSYYKKKIKRIYSRYCCTFSECFSLAEKPLEIIWILDGTIPNPCIGIKMEYLGNFCCFLWCAPDFVFIVFTANSSVFLCSNEPLHMEIAATTI